MKYFYSESYIQDGKLDNRCGRIIIYNNDILVSYNHMNDHNDLLRGFAARFQYKKDEIISNAIRLYFRHEGDRIIVSPRRGIDDDMFKRRWDFHRQLVKKELH